MIGDTDFFIDLAHPRSPGHGAAREAARRAESRGGRIAMTAVTRTELSCGVALFARPEEERDAVRALLAAYPTYPLDGPAADLAGTIVGTLRSRGAGIGVLDAMIAAIALERGEEVLTRNRREYSRVEGLEVVTY